MVVLLLTRRNFSARQRKTSEPRVPRIRALGHLQKKSKERWWRMKSLLPGRWNAAGIQRNLALNHHLQSRARVQLYIIAAREQSDSGSHRPSHSSPDRGALPAMAKATNHRTRPGRAGHCPDLLAGLAMLSNGAFLPFHRSLVGSGYVLDRPPQQHGVTAGINQGSEMHQDFGPPLDSSRTLHAADLAMHISAGRNQDTVVLHNRKSRLGINCVAFAGALRRNGMLKRERDLGPSRDGQFVRGGRRRSGRGRKLRLGTWASLSCRQRRK